MRFFVFIFSIFIALAVPLSFAAANDSEPPAMPGGEGTVFGLAIFANGTTASNAPLVILARGNKSDTIYRLITDPSGRFVLSFSKGSYQIDALLDYYSTPGIDFAATGEVDAAVSNATLVFYPAGSLAGSVLDFGSPVPSAHIRVSCPSDAFDYSRINGGTTFQSGDAGDFLVRALPLGTCVVSASTDSLAGSAEVQIKDGQTSSVTVQMKRKSGTDWLPFIIPLLIVAMVSVYFGRLSMGKVHGAQHRQEAAQVQASAPQKTPAHHLESAPHTVKKKLRPVSNEEEPELADKISDPKVKAVLATLSDREREIVRFLFKSGGRAKRSSIQHKLLIPKTSLLRNLRSLERKKIVKLTPFGRNLLAEIEGWLHM